MLRLHPFQVLAEEGEKLKDPMDLIYPEEVPLFDKYDEYVPPELVRKGFACGVLRMDEVKARAAEWGRNGGRTPVSPERVISLPQKEPRH